MARPKAVRQVVAENVYARPPVPRPYLGVPILPPRAGLLARRLTRRSTVRTRPRGGEGVAGVGASRTADCYKIVRPVALPKR